MPDQETVWDWFTTALLHDLAKTRLNKNGQWQEHNLLARPLPESLFPILSKFPMNFNATLGERVVERVEQQHEIQENLTRNDHLALAVAIADGVQKAMHGMVDDEGKTLENHPALSTLNHHYSFYPYYGKPITKKISQDKTMGYTEETAAQLFMRAYTELQKGKSLEHLIKVQDILLRYPHTTYIPHLSLGLHQQLAADLFYFAYRALNALSSGDARELRELVFYLVALRPEPLALYYRMRDLQVYKNTSTELSKTIFELLFREFKNDLPELAVDCNPFMFFHQTAMVFLYDDRARIQTALDALAQDSIAENFRALNAEISEYRISLWEGERLFANPNIAVTQESVPLLPPSAKTFHIVSPKRCRRCGVPLPAEWNEPVCAGCLELLNEYGEATVSLDAVARGEEKETTRLGYLFLRLDEPLLDNAKATAENLIKQFENDRAFTPRELLRPTKTGLLEYLQAVLELRDLQADILQLEDLNPIVQFPELMIYVMNERAYYENVESLSAMLTELKLNYRFTGMLVARTTPFWSLMDDLATGVRQHEARAAFYDSEGGDIVMFSSQEIQDIRRLASMLNPNAQIKNQLNILVTTAGNDSLDGLILQLDVRMNQNKIFPRFGNDLRAALSQMPGDDLAARTKRALFIKNIIRLIGFGSQGQNQNRPPRPQQGTPQRASRER